MTRLLLSLTLSLFTGCASDKDSENDTGSDSSCAQATHFPALTANAANSAYDDPSVEVSCTDDAVVVVSNGIPAYEFVAVTPNGLASQDWTWEIARDPEMADTMTDIPLLGTAGFAVNGIPIYGPNEGDFPDPYGDPILSDIMDPCLGHTAFE